MGRWRIVQGDALFSKYFELFEKQDGDEENDIRAYKLRNSNQNQREIRIMWRKYVEACDFMAQHSLSNFAATVRVLQRRLELIADVASLREFQQIFPGLWTNQEHLKDCKEAMETLFSFAVIRSIMVNNEDLR